MKRIVSLMLISAVLAAPALAQVPPQDHPMGGQEMHNDMHKSKHHGHHKGHHGKHHKHKDEAAH